MRPGAGISTSEPETAGSHSTWHSPVPYLFGGLAAMLGLIAFALLILACSYWKLSGYLESGEADAEARDADKQAASAKPAPSFVIMAGDVKPTYLATPICSRASSFADKAKDGDEGFDEENAIDGEVSAPLGDPTPSREVENRELQQ